MDPCLRRGMRAAWRGPESTFEPPVSVTLATEDVTQKKSEFDTALLPSVNYSPRTIVTSFAHGIETAAQAVSAQIDRRDSDLDIMAAITQIQPDTDVQRAAEEAVSIPSGNTRRGARKEMDDTIL